MNPRFPVYIISKGRHESRLTSKALESLRVPYFIVVEKQEFESYVSVIDKNKILILDDRFKDEYDIFSETPGVTSKGSGPARNFVWEHSIGCGADRHWIMDDNIYHFSRLNNNLKIKVSDGTAFFVMEEFVLRYKNIALAGPAYEFFAPSKSKLPPVVFNTRLYSCILIKNDIPFRWRCRYNEDVDLSIRILKSGLCTAQFNAFLQKKAQTQTMKGGNTDILYASGTLAKSQQLVAAHPDVTKLVIKYGRHHHQVDYRPFRGNALIRTDAPPSEGSNDFGMILKKKV